jgi:hypothetical protein
MKKIETIEYKELKDSDFVLTKTTEVNEGIFHIGYDVVYVNESREDKVKTVKSFRVKDMQILKTVMSSNEIHELSNFFSTIL